MELRHLTEERVRIEKRRRAVIDTGGSNFASAARRFMF